MTDVTRIINAIQQGQKGAADELLPLVYDELRRLAAQKLARESPGQTLQATALVHEAYLRLLGAENQNWDNKGHFFAAAAEAMRRIIVDTARRKKSHKHGGDKLHVKLDERITVTSRDTSPDDMLALDEALDRLSQQDKQKADLVKLCLFAGLSAEQASDALDISRSKAYEDLAYAKAWLRLAIRGADTEGTTP